MEGSCTAVTVNVPEFTLKPGRVVDAQLGQRRSERYVEDRFSSDPSWLREV